MDVHSLDTGINDEIAVGKISQRHCVPQLSFEGRDMPSVQFPFVSHPIPLGKNTGLSRLAVTALHVKQDNLTASLLCNLGDTATHGVGANNADALNFWVHERHFLRVLGGRGRRGIGTRCRLDSLRHNATAIVPWFIDGPAGHPG